MSRILLSFLLLFAGPAGQAQMTAGNPNDECTIQGVVVSAAGGELLKKAAVVLCAAGTPNQCTGAATDALGQFEFKGVEPGRYQLSATCSGYIETPYGQRTLGGPGAILNLSRGTKLTGLAIELIPAGVIAGRVYDEDGVPVADAVVSELHPDYMNGQRRLRAGTVTRTNDLGEYRLWGLNPGQHLVLAEYKPARLATIQTEFGYLPTFYPSGLNAAHATPILLRGGDEVSNTNIDLQLGRAVRVRGHILGGGAHHQVFLLLRDISALGSLVPPIYAQEKDSDYQLYNVTPGSYYLYAVGRDQSGPVVNRQPLEVADADLEGVDMVLRGTSKFSGVLRIEGMLRAPNVRVSLTPRSGRMVIGSIPSAVTNMSGNFILEDVYPDDYDVQVDNIAGRFYLKSARLRGFDVLTNGVSADQGGTLDILIGRNGATIEGTVSKDQQPYGGATVSLVPDPPHRGQRHLYKLTSTDQSGRFVMEGVAPGGYKVFAWESAEQTAYADPDFLQPFELRGESAHVSEGSRVNVNLTLIPKAETD